MPLGRVWPNPTRNVIAGLPSSVLDHRELVCWALKLLCGCFRELPERCWKICNTWTSPGQRSPETSTRWWGVDSTNSSFSRRPAWLAPRWRGAWRRAGWGRCGNCRSWTWRPGPEGETRAALVLRWLAGHGDCMTRRGQQGRRCAWSHEHERAENGWNTWRIQIRKWNSTSFAASLNAS